ncbi:MAG: spore cortex biosynthesis protein YabQ [Clostridiales bacterium]|nr:spore cortex biosynthesis protein YabQ [Clostridiales bacterium]
MILEEGRLCLISLLAGMQMMAVYDLLRIFRGLVSHRFWVIQAEDLLYWLTEGLMIFTLMLYVNSGILRWYSLAAMALGMMIWNGGISAFCVPGITRFFRWMKRRWKKLTSVFRQKLRKKIEKERKK